MKGINKLLINQFKSKIRKIISSYPSQSINFSQFMHLLSINYIRMYSKVEITKMKKFFSLPDKVYRIQAPLSYLVLDCVQQCDKIRYFVVKVSSQKVHHNLMEIQEKRHNVMGCLETFVRIMRRLYGSYKNWFKVLGGLTVSITIESAIFLKSLAKILCNTSHTNCAEGLTQLFLKYSDSDKIQWKGFMQVISNYDMVNQPIEPRFDLKSTNSRSVDITKIIFNNKNQMLLGSQSPQFKRKVSFTRPIKSAQSRTPHQPKKSLKTSIDSQFSQLIQFPKFFSVSAKPCILYQKKQQNKSMLINLSFLKQPKSNQKQKLKHRKMKTQPNFFQSKKANNNDNNNTNADKDINSNLNSKINKNQVLHLDKINLSNKSITIKDQLVGQDRNYVEDSKIQVQVQVKLQ